MSSSSSLPEGSNASPASSASGIASDSRSTGDNRPAKKDGGSGGAATMQEALDTDLKVETHPERISGCFCFHTCGVENVIVGQIFTHLVTIVEVFVGLYTFLAIGAYLGVVSGCGGLVFPLVLALIIHVVLIPWRCVVSVAAHKPGVVSCARRPSKRVSGGAMCGAFSCCCALVGFVVVIAFVIAAVLSSYGAHPRTSGHLNIDGFSATVSVEREASGVIHIVANNKEDLFMAQGFVNAQERLFQMDFYRRVGFGTLSALIGEAAIDSDKAIRSIGIPDSAALFLREYEENEDEAFRTHIDAFVAGVNAYMTSDNFRLPIEYKLLGVSEVEPWTVADVMSIGAVLSFDLNYNYLWEADRYGFMVNAGLDLDRITTLWPPAMPPIDQGGHTQYDPSVMGPFSNGTGNFNISVLYSDVERAVADAYLAGASGGSSRRDVADETEAVPRSSRQHNANARSGSKKAFWWVDTRHSVLGRASNNWAVGGSRTESGDPMIANDPHLGLTMPALWMLLHLEAPGIDVIGASLPFAAGVVIGRNRDIAWAMTNAGTDVQDLYVMEDRLAGDGTTEQYYYNGTWMDYELDVQTIEVAGGDDISYTVKRSVYGPDVSDVLDWLPADQTICLRWAAADPALRHTTVHGYMDLNVARNWTEFQTAMRKVITPGQQALFASKEEGIGLQTQGRIPIRVDGHSGAIPMPGNGSYDWQGYLPAEQQPFMLNPPDDYIVTANEIIVDGSYEVIMLTPSDFEQRYRGARIRQMIEATDAHNMQTFKDMQADVTSLFAQDLMAAAFPAMRAHADATASHLAIMDRLEEWDGAHVADSEEATVFQGWFIELAKVVEAEVNDTYWDKPLFYIQAIPGGDPACPDGDCAKYALDALAAADSWSNGTAWGDALYFDIRHPVLGEQIVSCFSNRIVEGRGGGPYTVNVAKYEPDELATFKGSSYREIIDTTDMETSVFIHSGGRGGHPLDPSYDLFTELWGTDEYVPMQMDDYEVEETQTLT